MFNETTRKFDQKIKWVKEDKKTDSKKRKKKIENSVKHIHVCRTNTTSLLYFSRLNVQTFILQAKPIEVTLKARKGGISIIHGQIM